MLMQLIARAAQAAPGVDHPLMMTPGATLTYTQCRRRAETIAHALQRRGMARFGVAAADPADVIVLLVAASAIGSEACVYPRDLDADGWSGFAARLDHPVIVTDESATLAGGTSTVTLAELEAAEAPAPAAPAPATEAPVMILTTGTTGEPKGARHDWSRLAAAVRSPDAAGTRWLMAYNVNQFAGLQVLLHVIASGATAVVPASRRPADVVAALRDHAVTHVSATPTFWRLVVGHLDAVGHERLAIKQITLGGEAAPRQLLDRLHALFPQARISHVYAGTEFGSAVSVRDGLSGLPLSVLDRDDDAPVQMKIVDGELHMRSRVGMLGYHEAEAEAAAAGWQATGDLVEVADGRIHFVGRATEIINVGGAKIHPLPIEELACGVDGVQLAAAYGRPNAVTGQIVALDLVLAPDAEPDAAKAAVRTACAALPPAGRPRRIDVVDALEVRGNKLIRGHEDQP